MRESDFSFELKCLEDRIKSLNNVNLKMNQKQSFDQKTAANNSILRNHHNSLQTDIKKTKPI